jgi:hypothetical protein
MLNFDWLAGIPVETAKYIFLVLFIFIGILVSLIPKEYIYEGLENPRWYHNLKLWAWGDLILIFIVYLIF